MSDGLQPSSDGLQPSRDGLQRQGHHHRRGRGTRNRLRLDLAVMLMAPDDLGPKRRAWFPNRRLLGRSVYHESSRRKV